MEIEWLGLWSLSVHEALSVRSFLVDSDLELGSWGCKDH